MKKKVFLVMMTIFSMASLSAQKKGYFTNPILPSGPDPYSFFHQGYYYYTHTEGNKLVLWKTDNIAGLKSAEKKTIYIPPPGKEYSKDLWAPEILFLQNKWYAYFAADGGTNQSHRMYVLENASPDPMKGEWIMKGKLADATDKWAIDGDVFEFKGQLYMVWSGWVGDTNGQQDIFIAKMKNPYTIEGPRVRISYPQYEWEKIGDLNSADNPPHVNVNEGPQALQHGNDLFIIYSGSGCWTDFYALGQLRFRGTDNLLDSTAWEKKAVPVFKSSPANKVFATGHNSFFKSPDGKEDWILYHANSNPGDGCGPKRSPRAQPFTWNAKGEPVFGEPVAEGVAIPLPSGSKIK